jgi:hypothetical protein
MTARTSVDSTSRSLAILSIFVGLTLASRLRSMTRWRGAAESLSFTHAPRNWLRSQTDGIAEHPEGFALLCSVARPGQ